MTFTFQRAVAVLIRIPQLYTEWLIKNEIDLFSHLKTFVKKTLFILKPFSSDFHTVVDPTKEI